MAVGSWGGSFRGYAAAIFPPPFPNYCKRSELVAVHQQASTGEMVDDGQAAAPAKKDGQPVMRAKVYSPFQVYFEEEAYSVSGENGTGPFDILPHHHNFITLLNPCELVIRAPLGERRIRISGGVMHVKADNVTVFLDV